MAVSVIIPVLNEAAVLAQSLRALRRQQPLEIIVVDGGSTDGSLEAAKAADLLLQAERGRARQMNAGARRAGGDVLLFLHADCRLDEGALTAAGRIMQRKSVVAACFRQRIEAEGVLYRWIELVASARVGLVGIAYGDQGLVLRRETFLQLGGFPDALFLEDVVMSRRLRRLARLVQLKPAVHCSPRRWQRAGLIRQTVRNWTLLTLAALGVSPARLARYYPPVR
jgi:rSAM/selenodomain-associated transferase 2